MQGTFSIILMMSLSMGVMFCMMKGALGPVFNVKGPQEPGYGDFFLVGCFVGLLLGIVGWFLQLCAGWIFG